MVFCGHCQDDCPYVQDPDNGITCCGMCGKVLDEHMFDVGPTFVKNSSGQNEMAGKIIEGVGSGCSISRERTEAKGRDEIWQIVHGLHVSSGDDIICTAHNFYKLALDNDFTKGRRTSPVAAACLYIACRRGLLGKRDNAVSDTALRIVASMKRDWMQTGRKPSGLCGAALYIAALSHGYDYTKADIAAVVHVCEATLFKRLIEFENTDSGSLTIEDFLAKADEETVPKCSAKYGEVLCEHKGAEHFSHGLCEECYYNFTELSGGLEGGADPPAFQRAEKKRHAAAKRAKDSSVVDAALCELHSSDVEHNIMSPGKNCGGKSLTVSSSQTANDFVAPIDPEVEGENGKADSDPENLSDIDDVEVDGYLHNEEETQNKKIIWEEMNKEYLEEQAAKEALAAELAARGVSVGEGRPKKRKRNEDKLHTR